MKKRYWLIAIFAFIVCFIWGNSVFSSQISSAISKAVGEFFASIFGTGNGATTVGGLSVRKMAHFIEFAVLGIAASLLFKLFAKNRFVYALLLALCGLFVALMDETIQIFSQRGSSVRDVWIDILGYSVACLAVEALCLIRVEIKRKNTDKK
ncbi:MAG: VanZ family protein [Ruminococcaceae bacterium]|nr:VanZ family protein [Oscillospiraceae bacterium]